MEELIELYKQNAIEHDLILKISVVRHSEIRIHLLAQDKAKNLRARGDMEIGFSQGKDIEQCAKEVAKRLEAWVK